MITPQEYEGSQFVKDCQMLCQESKVLVQQFYFIYCIIWDYIQGLS